MKNKLIKKIIIGTANFNYTYSKKKIQYKEIKKIFSTLNKKKIFKLDTAVGYKNYSLLKKFNLKKFTIFTKLSHKDILYYKNLEDTYNFSNKCKELIILSHDPHDLKNKSFLKLLNNQKKFNIGYSIYDIKDLPRKNLKKKLYLQLPFNILLYQNFEKLKKKNYVTISRSVFMRGHLNLSIKKILKTFDFAKNKLDNFSKISKKINLNFAQISLLYSLLNKNIDFVIIGINSNKELIENLRVINDKNIKLIKKFYKSIELYNTALKNFQNKFDMRKI